MKYGEQHNTPQCPGRGTTSTGDLPKPSRPGMSIMEYIKEARLVVNTWDEDLLQRRIDWLAKNPGATAIEFGEAHGIAYRTASKYLTDLIHKGLVEREPQVMLGRVGTAPSKYYVR